MSLPAAAPASWSAWANLTLSLVVTAVGKPVRIKQPDVKRVSPAEVAAALGAEPWLPPGSDEALAAGCKCPVLDNARDRGYMGCPGAWVKLATCPLHGQDVSGTSVGSEGKGS